MSPRLSLNTQAILLLTAPLLAGRGTAASHSLTPEVLTPGEFKKLSQHLHSMEREPADLLAPESAALQKACEALIGADRLQRLLARGFLLGQAVDRWQSRALWVVSRTDEGYPRRLSELLKENAPPILYGCGDAKILGMGGLAVVGSRNADDTLIEFTLNIGRLTAAAGKGLVSGGARGIDQAAMRGALEEGGAAIGFLADSLEQAAMNREHRNLLMEGRLVLVSPYDPAAGFNVGHAMQRNKLIYALSDVALVVSSDYEKGGTWAGAVEQLGKFKFVPVYVRASGETSAGLAALGKKGALPWPDPRDAEGLGKVFDAAGELRASPSDSKVDMFAAAPIAGTSLGEAEASAVSSAPAEDPSARVRELLSRAVEPKTEEQLATELQVSKRQARAWLHRLVGEGVIEKLRRPVRYRLPPAKQVAMFEHLDPPHDGEIRTGR